MGRPRPLGHRGRPGCLAVKLNGPRHWVLDGIGQKVNTQEPVLREFNGLRMRRLALIDLGDHPSTSPYTDNPRGPGRGLLLRRRQARLRAGVPDGLVYVMQAYCVAVDPTTDEASLRHTGRSPGLPDGWTYRVRTLEEELVVDTTHKSPPCSRTSSSTRTPCPSDG